MGLISAVVFFIWIAVACILVGISLYASAAVLKWAVSATNAVLGGRTPTDGDYAYDTMSGALKLKNPGAVLIPQPTTSQAIAMVVFPSVLTVMLQFAVLFGVYGMSLLVKADGDGWFVKLFSNPMVILLSIPLSLAVWVGLLSGMLGTTVVKAFVVVVMDTLAWTLICAAIVGAMFFFGAITSVKELTN